MAQQFINNLETGALVRGKINDNFTEVYNLATNGLSGPTGASNVGIGSKTVEERIDTRAGEEVTITTTSGASAARVGENILATNSTSVGQYGVRFVSYVKSGDLNTGENDISDALIARYNNVTNGFGWLRWNVLQSPLNESSGLPGAPSGAQSFKLLTNEINPQNRHSNNTWQGESRGFTNSVGGDQMVPETQDFTSLLPAGTRIGYDVSYGYLLSKSPITNSNEQRHARLINGILANPNAFAPGGAFLFATGFRNYPTAVAIASGGTGYTAGDFLAFNTGLSQAANENTVLRVKTVDGSGVITSVEIYTSGWYQQTFATTVGVTGGTGTGATFTYTLASTAVAPRAYAGIAGNWDYGFDGASWVGTNSNVGSADFNGAMIRSPNDQKIIVARNAANNADVDVLEFTSGDVLKFNAREARAPLDYTPSYTADSGTLTDVTTVSARYSVLNGVCTFSVTFLIVTKGTASGALRVSLPVNAAQASTVIGRNSTDGFSLVGAIDVANPTYARVFRYDVTDPMADGKFYNIAGSYEVAV